MKQKILKTTFVLFLLCIKIQAQNPAEFDTSFDTGEGFYGLVTAIAVQPDGKILVGGMFNSYDGQTQNKFIRLNADGSKDTSFDIGTGFYFPPIGSSNNLVQIRQIVVQPDGKILVGGRFRSYNEQTRWDILRLNAEDGSIDTSFIAMQFQSSNQNPASIGIIILQPDGKMIVSGSFTTLNGQNQRYIVRLNADGSKDASFNLEYHPSEINSIALMPDGKILILANISGQEKLIRFNSDGSLDTDTLYEIIETEFNTCFKIVLQPDGKILAEGKFNPDSQSSGRKIIRLNTDGSKDTTFDIGETGFSFNSIFAVTLQPDGKILVGGDFVELNGQPEKKLVRLNSDGSKDTSFDIGTGFLSAYSYIQAITLQSDGKILVGGEFTSYNGHSFRNLVRLLNNEALSIVDFDSTEVKTRPNPVINEFMISVACSKVELFDVLGKKVFEQNDVNSSVDISHLSKGLYIVKGQTANGNYTVKIVKQ
ncbi:T9SS type A sorting domain-containing protein [Flavobacterium azooxidireducens]|uniref:T9SS type A sorting domain-containing protein n=1 Tax=Flavobacterium azooxidireducens TaxID=1871076 RepID=A0ABY4KC63_9FLAO|nr:T9SS type A sorting domain-containing protein [Flavobacterium azooxidireducens]UPQ78372.1 T9SS type A sorting domain-containing protein [Flavobacterium azooxidireducens]